MRKRRFTRTLISYTLSLWLVVQVADIGFPLLEVPDSVLGVIIIGGILALPIVLTAAWIAERILDRNTRIDDQGGFLATAIFVLLLLGVVALACTTTLLANKASAIVHESPLNDCTAAPETALATKAISKVDQIRSQ